VREAIVRGYRMKRDFSPTGVSSLWARVNLTEERQCFEARITISMTYVGLLRR